jgi:hypothetical protein
MPRFFERLGRALAAVALLTATAAAQQALPELEAVDVSGTYTQGSFEYQLPGGALMRGRATLEVRGNRFTLRRDEGPALSGSINLFQLPKLNNYPTGRLQFDGGPIISVRWYRDGDVLKVVRSQGVRSLFRFCTRTLTVKQCRTRI